MRTIRAGLAAWLRRLAAWVAPVDPAVDALSARVRALVDEADGLDASGPYKKWQFVAGRLAKEYPEADAADLNLRIELAVRDRRAGAC